MEALTRFRTVVDDNGHGYGSTMNGHKGSLEAAQMVPQLYWKVDPPWLSNKGTWREVKKEMIIMEGTGWAQRKGKKREKWERWGLYKKGISWNWSISIPNLSLWILALFSVSGLKSQPKHLEISVFQKKLPSLISAKITNILVHLRTGIPPRLVRYWRLPWPRYIRKAYFALDCIYIFFTYTSTYIIKGNNLEESNVDDIVKNVSFFLAWHELRIYLPLRIAHKALLKSAT